MFKKFESDVRRKVKEIMAVALSFCLLFGTLGMPIRVTAAGGFDSFNESNIEADLVLLPGDNIQFDQTGDSDTYNRKSLSNIYYSLNGTDYSVHYKTSKIFDTLTPTEEKDEFDFTIVQEENAEEVE